MREISIYTDGASRGNPGPAAIGVVIKNEWGENLKTISKSIGEATNNVAEYQALIEGLKEAVRLKPASLKIYSDSELMVKQLKGQYKVREPHLLSLFEEAKRLLSTLKKWEVIKVKREENLEADALANQILNKESVKSVDYCYGLAIRDHFDAAHFLRNYQGKCSELHGHTWGVEVKIEGFKLNQSELLFDFQALKKLLKQTLSAFDHAFLNEVPPFDKISPTGENLARFIYQNLENKLPPGIRLVSVKVEESPSAWVEVSKKNS